MLVIATNNSQQERGLRRHRPAVIGYRKLPKSERPLTEPRAVSEPRNDPFDAEAVAITEWGSACGRSGHA